MTFELDPSLQYDGVGILANSDEFVSVLQQYQSCTIAIPAQENQGFDLDDANGVEVTSDRYIVVNTGVWTGGPSLNNIRKDIGFDQLIPTALAGNEYVLVRGNAPASSLL